MVKPDAKPLRLDFAAPDDEFSTFARIASAQTQTELDRALSALRYLILSRRSGSLDIGPYRIQGAEGNFHVTPAAPAIEEGVKATIRAILSERGRNAAHALHANTVYAKLKLEVLAAYENSAASIRQDGRPLYKSKAAFIKAMQDKHSEIADRNTISNWISGWVQEGKAVVPHWKTRAQQKKEK